MSGLHFVKVAKVKKKQKKTRRRRDILQGSKRGWSARGKCNFWKKGEVLWETDLAENFSNGSAKRMSNS